MWVGVWVCPKQQNKMSLERSATSRNDISMLIMGHGAPRAMNLFKADYNTGRGKWAMHSRKIVRDFPQAGQLHPK
jgi:hypothetical protein